MSNLAGVLPTGNGYNLAIAWKTINPGLQAATIFT
jgi:hypothetical protein